MLSIEKIKQLRLSFGLTQEQVAKCYVKDDGKVGCSRNHIIMLERGSTAVTPQIYKKWIDAIYQADKKKRQKR